MSDPVDFSEPNRPRYDLDSEGDLRQGADDSPDILLGVPEDEPDLSNIPLHETAFRTPHAGDHLTADELARDLD